MPPSAIGVISRGDVWAENALKQFQCGSVPHVVVLRIPDRNVWLVAYPSPTFPEEEHEDVAQDEG